MDAWLTGTGQGCWSVDVIHLTGTPGRRDGEWLRISCLGYHVESSGIAVDGRGRQVAAGVALIVRLLDEFTLRR
jgi:hypothetical protein